MDLETKDDAGPWRKSSGYLPAMNTTSEGTSETGRTEELYSIYFSSIFRSESSSRTARCESQSQSESESETQKV